MATIDEKGFRHGRVGGETYYVKNGVQIVRPAKNTMKYGEKKKGNAPFTKKKFVEQQRHGNNSRLWKVMKTALGEVNNETTYFEGGYTAFNQFIKFNHQLPAVFLSKTQDSFGACLLLPGIAISDGTLPAFNYELGEVNGVPALLTDLAEDEAHEGKLLLYVLRQEVKRNDTPKVSAKVTELNFETKEVNINKKRVNIETIDGCITLTGDLFADEMAGFGLVHIVDDHVSSQHIVTRCTYYERFTGEEVMKETAKSYGRVEDYGGDWKCYPKKK